MSDTFDPDPWSSPTNGNGRGKQPQPPPAWEDDDDWSSSTFGGGNASATYDDAFGAEPARPAPRPSASHGAADDDPWGTPSGYGDFGDDPFAAPARDTGGAAHKDDFGDDFFEDQPSRQTAPRSPKGQRDHDDFEAGYEDDRYDDFDYDDFDDDPGRGGNGKRILIVVLVVLLVGGVAYAITQLTGSKEPTVTDDTNLPAGKDDGNATPVTIPNEVKTSLDQAMAAWGRFAINGKLDEVRPYFKNEGRQYQSLETEAASIANANIGGPPETYQVTIKSAVQPDKSTWLLSTDTVMSRPNEQAQHFPWEIRLVKGTGSQAWVIESVRLMN